MILRYLGKNLKFPELFNNLTMIIWNLSLFDVKYITYFFF